MGLCLIVIYIYIIVISLKPTTANMERNTHMQLFYNNIMRTIKLNKKYYNVV